MPVDWYIELISHLGLKKIKRLPSEDLEKQVFKLIQVEAQNLLRTSSETDLVVENQKRIEHPEHPAVFCLAP